MANLQPDTVVVTASCLCRAHAFSVAVSRSSLPLEATACHCDSCRHASGAMYVQVATWPQPKESVDLGGLQRYQFSADLAYRFCGTCSASMFYEYTQEPSRLSVVTGVLANTEVNLIHVTRHIFVGDTLDGGATVWLRTPNPDGKAVPRYRTWVDAIPWDGSDALPAAADEKEDNEPQEPPASVPIVCHCGGVNFRLHRGPYASMDRAALPWNVDPATNKLLASFDACDSCRTQYGTDLVNWTFSDLAYLATADDNRDGGRTLPTTTAALKVAVDRCEPALGTLVYYQSSAAVQRYFCRVCSAGIFYTHDDRPTMVDIAIGVLTAPDGVRAESLLSWNMGGTPAWVQDAKGGWREGLVERIRAGAEEYRLARNYPKNWHRVRREAEGITG
ncbi:Mss4-like protein [Niveomyces insectorum RCEF 264]|uniref:Mss4-like protein n=1 Tax=Niveomyces insectorum RCEF 264 TaxID=1081102 RepID=A0A167MNH5_9HYPO|nr:Mss4-like protein [Niveomyces insectorum RCEF 264]